MQSKFSKLPVFVTLIVRFYSLLDIPPTLINRKIKCCLNYQ
jgi:hypothetical protein